MPGAGGGPVTQSLRGCAGLLDSSDDLLADVAVDSLDVVEVARRRFLPDVKVKKIDIGTDQLAPIEEGGTPTNVSTIEITLAK